jgi:REP element-mobilizing transposase RayT
VGTYRRVPWITAEIEPALHQCIRSLCERHHCHVLALNGMPDHVHTVIHLHSTIAVARLMNIVKGASSDFARDQLRVWQREEEGFGWQDNYAAISLSPSHLKNAIAYVQNQKQRHAAGKLWPHWEETETIIPGQ